MFQQNECTILSDLKLDNCGFCLGRSESFSLLTKEELDKIEKSKVLVNFKKGETIFKQGTTATHSVSFAKGLAKLHDDRPNGEIIYRFIKPVELINGYGLLFNETHHYSVTALTDATCCLIPVGIVADIMEKNTGFRRLFIKDIQMYNFLIQDRLADLLSKRNPGRIAGSLINLSKNVYKTNKFHCDFGRKELQSYCCVSQDGLSKTLKQFEEAEIIKTKGRKIELLKPKILEKIWQFG